MTTGLQHDLDQFSPAEPLGPGGGCAICGNPGHSTHNHALLEVLNRQTEFLAVLAGVLEPKRYRLGQRGVEDGTGKGTIMYDLSPGGVDKLVMIERIAVATNSTGTPACAAYVMEGIPGPYTLTGGVLTIPSLLVPPSPPRVAGPIGVNGTGELLSDAPIMVKGGENFFLQWTGLSAGALIQAHIQYRLAWQSPD